MNKSIKVFAPGSVSNVGCGFDILGFAIDGIGDEMIINKNDSNKIHIKPIEGYENLPTEPSKNVASVAIQAMLDNLGSNQGFDLEIMKNIKPGSGIGSSSASAAGAVVAVNELLGKPYSREQLVNFAMQGEVVASGDAHADNAAPTVLGGFCIVRAYDPLDVIQIESPKDLWCVVIHPQIEIKTSESRAILPKEVKLQDAIAQWSNFGSLIHGLHTNDYNLISRSLKDVIIEPHRSKLIPHYNEVKNAALNAGALGSGISGSGPSIFTLCEGIESANNVKDEIKKIYSKTNIEFDIHVSKINTEGIKVI